jgi:hypothetical protein
MKTVFRLCPLAIFAAALLSGCGKKDADVISEAERALPKEEQMPAPTALPGQEQPAAPAIAERTEVAPPADVPSDAEFEAWFKKHGLDLNDPNMLTADADGDGFSNSDEFLADSDPKNPESRPGIHKTIRLKDYTEARLPFVLRSVDGESATVEFNGDGGGSGQREKIRRGETIRGTTLKVDRIEARTDTDKHGEKVDMSQLVMTDTASNGRIVALKDLPTRTSASFATLVGPDGQTTMKVREGETFAWPEEPSVTYKVIDLRPDQVVVKDEASGKTVTIPKQ